MAESPLQLVSQISIQLAQLARPNKDFLVKSLRQGASALSQIEQPLSHEPSERIKAVKNLESVTKTLRKTIVKHSLLHHSDKDVKLLVAICVSELFRILAPEPPFEDKYLRDVFKLIFSMFSELADTKSPYFSRRVKILETVARCKCCVILLDIDSNDLVLEMFNIFFSVVRKDHQQCLKNDILSIITHVLNEEASQPLSDIILQNLVKDEKGIAASQLAVSVIQSCGEKLKPFICGFLTSCLMDRDAVTSELKEFYHEIMLKIFQYAPQILLAVIPNLVQELLIDQVDVRIKAVNLVGKLFALPDNHIARKYHGVFVEFLKRFSDKSAEVRVAAIQCAEACYKANFSGPESHEVLSALEGRLLDFDDKVRTQAVIVACDITKSYLKFVPSKLISEAAKRLRDKKISVRKKALQKLTELYQEYCNKCSEGLMTISDDFEQIPCNILLLCYDKDCMEFRPQNMEFVLAEGLFPALLSVKERTRHWIHLFSLITPQQLKALNSILSQKRRLQTEMQKYLALRKKEKDNDTEETQKRIKSSFIKMSASFPNPAKAEECFYKLNQMKVNNIFTALALLLDQLTNSDAQASKDKFLKEIGVKHPFFEFLQPLSSKCSFNIFSSDHVSCILDHLLSNRFGNKQSDASSVKLLQVIISVFPLLLRGSEEKFQMLLEERLFFGCEPVSNSITGQAFLLPENEEIQPQLSEENDLNDKLIEVLAKAGSNISAKLCDFYPILKRICLEGTRTQSKYAVSAIASLISTSGESVFSELCKELVETLHMGRNIPTVLQSLGCIAQCSASSFESQDENITSYIYDCILKVNVESLDDLALPDETSGSTATCKLKIYGLKTLVKSFLPHRGSHVRRQINKFFDILSKMLQTGDTIDDVCSCESEKAHIRLAAAKSVLQLSRRWDLHISPDIFHFTILMAKDSSSFVRRQFLNKTHKLLKEHAIPTKYACAFVLATSDNLKDLQDDSNLYVAEFIKDYSTLARIRQTSALQGGSITDYPAYIVVFLIHVLAHDRDFPPEDCEDEETFAQFCSPIFSVVQALVNASTVDGDMDLVSDAVLYLICIFRAIKKAEDAVDGQQTPKLHLLADIGISIVNALNHNGFSSSHFPGLILLPSALYRISVAEKSEETISKCIGRLTCGESFVRRVIQVLKSRISLPASSLTKHGRNCQEDKTRSDVVKDSMINSVLCKQVILSTTGTNETHSKSMKQETSVGNRRKRAPSPALVGLHECSTVKEPRSTSRDFEAILEKKHLSSPCDSLTTEPSIRNATSSASLKQNCMEHSSVAAEPSKYPRVKDSRHSKEITGKSGALIGQRIRLLSPVDRCFYLGTVDSFNSENNIHKITYDSGKVELLCLDSESWETISDNSKVERDAILADTSNTLQSHHRNLLEYSSLSMVEETDDIFGKDAAQMPKTLSNQERGKSFRRMVPLPAKGKKRPKVSADMPGSEVTDTNQDAIVRRSRRRKV
ncbi:Cnd1 domain-containing protein [Cephalotus follicularis]|uniref:Cnd1 domain-containing protein n=1 Tax=Cephalotus follicularis TaxID=3775 RepID=A0A1Q3BVG9_CEPFO|nr:Cnd1 domain-containing protein [Cephalotus follicularis]